MSIAELLERARRGASGCKDSGARDAIGALCDAIEQMQRLPDPVERLCNLIDVATECDKAREEERERIALYVRTLNISCVPFRTMETIAQLIRESA